MLVLGIESSCDDTSVALLDCSPAGCFVIKEITASQIEIHQKYGGVVPEIAGRMHAEKIVPLIEEVLRETPPYPPLERGGNGFPSFQGGDEGEVSPNRSVKPDIIAVTAGPGLITGLIVGVEAARTLVYAWDIPLVAVNHIEGHIHSTEISNFQFPNCRLAAGISNFQKPINDSTNQQITYPALALVVSGGHTELIFIKKPGQYKIIGQTRDDAAGECFDKVAKLLGLPYPGGPQISKLAQTGRTDAINFPRPMLKEKGWDFSFAGLKTSALYWLEKNAKKKTIGYELLAMNYPDFCASFEQAIVDVLVGKTIAAAQELKPKSIILAGGVSANTKLRATLANQITHSLPNTYYLTPNTSYSMDNAAMIAVAGYYHAIKKDFTPWNKITANPNWSVDN